MAAVQLGRALIGLASDMSTQVVIPVLTSMTRASSRDTAFVRFAGDTFPTAIHGEGQDERLSWSCMYPRDDHDELAKLLRLLLVTVPAAPDARLFLRTHAGAAVGTNYARAVVLDGDVAETWAHEAVTVTLPVRVVQYSAAV